MSYSSLTFPHGRPVITSVAITRQRPLPVGATPLVSVGERVTPEQVVAEQRVDQGVKGVLAGLSGRVTAITVGRSVTIDGVATLLNGVIGVGGPAAGMLYTIPRGESLAVAHIPHGCVLLHPTRAPLMLLQRALASGAAGVIAASATALELEAFARADLMTLLEGQAPPTPPQPLTVVLTEGVGEAVIDSTLWHMLTRRLRRCRAAQRTDAATACSSPRDTCFRFPRALRHSNRPCRARSRSERSSACGQAPPVGRADASRICSGMSGSRALVNGNRARSSSWMMAQR